MGEVLTESTVRHSSNYRNGYVPTIFNNDSSTMNESSTPALVPPPRRKTSKSSTIEANNNSGDHVDQVQATDHRKEIEREVHDLLELDRRTSDQLKGCYSLLKTKYEKLQRENQELVNRLQIMADGAAKTSVKHQAEVGKLSQDLTSKVEKLERSRESNEERFQAFRTQLQQELTVSFTEEAELMLAQLHALQNAQQDFHVEKQTLLTDRDEVLDRLNQQRENFDHIVAQNAAQAAEERSQLLQRIDELSKAACDFRFTETDHQAQVERLEAANKKLEKQLETHRLTANEQMAVERDKFHELKMENDHLATEKKSLESGMTVLRQQITGLQADLKVANAEKLAALREFVDTDHQARQELLDTSLRLHSALSQIDLLKSKNSNAEMELEEAKRKATSSAEQSPIKLIQNAESSKLAGESSQDDLHTSYNDQIKKLEKEKSNLNEKGKALEDKLLYRERVGKERDLDAALRLKDLQWERNKLEKELVSLRKKARNVDNFKAEIKQLNRDLDEKRYDFETANSQLTKLLISNKPTQPPSSAAISESVDKMEVKRLRKLVAEKEEELKKQKTHYRSLLKKMKRQYEALERKYKQQQKSSSRKSSEAAATEPSVSSPGSSSLTGDLLIGKLRNDLDQNDNESDHPTLKTSDSYQFDDEDEFSPVINPSSA